MRVRDRQREREEGVETLEKGAEKGEIIKTEYWDLPSRPRRNNF